MIAPTGRIVYLLLARYERPEHFEIRLLLDNSYDRLLDHAVAVVYSGETVSIRHDRDFEHRRYLEEGSRRASMDWASI